MVPGMWGKALYIDGQPGSRVEYGVHTDGCFFDPDQCDQGITFSLWLRFQGRPSADNIIMDNGGCRPYGIGFCVSAVNDLKFFTIRQRSQNVFYAFNINGYTDYQWHIVSFTNVNDDTNIYISMAAKYPQSSPQLKNLATFHIMKIPPSILVTGLSVAA